MKLFLTEINITKREIDVSEAGIVTDSNVSYDIYGFTHSYMEDRDFIVKMFKKIVEGAGAYEKT